MQIETVAVERLIPYARNSRTHSPEQVAQIAASIREFGFTNPVLIDAEGGIIAGHGRVMGARQLQMADVPCIRLGHLTEAQRRAYVIADNKLAANAGWDEEMLGLELRELMAAGYDVGLTGFELPEIDELVAGIDAPGRMEKSFSQSGRNQEENADAYLQETFQNFAKYPVTVILDEKEHEKWSALKEKRGFGDKRLFLELMEKEKC